jgi:HSP20 family protein
MGKIMDQLQKGFYSFAAGETWTPSVNLYETDSSYHVCVDLAGVEKDKIEVVVADQVLTLRGRRPVPHIPEESGQGEARKRVRVHLMEVDHGAFSRQVELPHDVQQTRIQAQYVDGMLWIHLPKKTPVGGSRAVRIDEGAPPPDKSRE